LFTGIVKTTGRVTRTAPGIAIETALASSLEEGESISVDGACLTVEAIRPAGGGSAFTAHLSSETIRRTIAGSYRSGSVVNLERSLGLGDLLGGHLVTGHVDSVGTVTRIQNRRDETTVSVRYDERYSGLVVEKGSVTLNGISLTIAGLTGRGVLHAVMVPETLERTNSSSWRTGTKLNMEFDLIGKYVQRYLALNGGMTSPGSYGAATQPDVEGEER
jgi:riboflavin synthase